MLINKSTKSNIESRKQFGSFFDSKIVIVNPYERNNYIKIIEYDFSKGTKNTYSKVLKRQITINLSEEVLDYFKDLFNKTNIAYQTLINFYLLDCVKNKKSIDISWNN